MKVKYFIDMDGVVVKWNSNASEEETHTDGYFFEREADKNAVDFVLKLFNRGYDVTLYSSVYEDDHSANDKDRWRNKEGLGCVKRIYVPYGKDKAEYLHVEDGDLPVLIDDYKKNLESWRDAGYLAIKYMNDVNSVPKIWVDGDVVRIKPDSWTGYSIDYRMDSQMMFTAVTSIAEAMAA